MKKFHRILLGLWQPLLLYGLAIAALLFMLGYRLGHLPAGLSSTEVSTLSSSSTWHALLDNPLYAPQTILIRLLHLTGLGTIAVYRLASVFWAVITLGLFFGVLLQRFSKGIAILGTIMLASSTWFLITARSINPEIMQTGWIVLLTLGGWLRYGKGRVLPVLLAAVSLAALVYVPGLIWFILLGLTWRWRTIKQNLHATPGMVSLLAPLLFAILVAPLIFAISRNPHLGLTVLGVSWPLPGLQSLLHNLASVPLAFFGRAPLNPSHWLGRLALLDVFSMSMFALGAYSFYLRRQLSLTKVVVGIILLGWALVGFGAGITYTILLPAVYLIIAAGVNLMMEQWFAVFPRNPLARALGVVLLTVAVCSAIGYQGFRYYVAWQHAPETKAAYHQQIR